jgi:group I intron endonuclease
MGYIYLITNTINGKRYVGQTQREDIEKRWKEHKICDKYTIGRCLLNAYKKHGIETFKFQIICVCFDEDCNKFEGEYIEKYNTLSPKGYNLKSGGRHGRHHPETIKLISEKLKGRQLTPVTDEIRRKNSQSKMGDKNHNFGKSITEERRIKLSNAIKRIWQERRDNGTFNEYIKNSSVPFSQKGRISPNRKAVGKYDDKGSLLETYTSTVEAGLKMGISSSTIACVCRGVKSYKTAGGFIWKFL